MEQRVMETLDLLGQQVQEQISEVSDVDEASQLLERLQIGATKIQTKILNEENLLTPIGKLPNEMLLKVFEHCVEGVLNTDYRERRASLHLWTAIIHTCARWRLLGFQHRALWSEIDLTWPRQTIDRFLVLSGEHPLNLFLTLDSERLPRYARRVYLSLLEQCAPRLSGFSISYNVRSGIMWGVEKLLDDFVSLKLPVLQRFVATREPMSQGPTIISCVISPALKVLVLRAIEPNLEFSYGGLTAVYIDEVELGRQDLLALLEENESLRTLELGAGLLQCDDSLVDEYFQPFQHNISTLRVGPLRVQDVVAIFDEVDFQNLSELALEIREENQALQLPAALRPFVHESFSLKLSEDSLGRSYHLAFQSHPYRTYQITLIVSPSLDRSARSFWEAILSQLALSWSPSQLTTLEINMSGLPDGEIWALFLRTCCSKLRHLSLFTADTTQFLNALTTDVGLLPNLETLDLER
ncbi:hypothetical protein SISNIDRAFT_517609 [Sistotremastrum niveocremeum HHB9708]|uniref:Uncharacterized protein n=1 Tax=Sistotremastrum niveocremeum HHB9708 TaxID=1314777 RepID=A0A164RZP3_9AGAM|nr:hypothetical protein SISNIDRAFT_517609 [Sistotremastrum niveocremeum HHB9708]